MNATQAAAAIGCDRRTLYRMIERGQIEKPSAWSDEVVECAKRIYHQSQLDRSVPMTIASRATEIAATIMAGQYGPAAGITEADGPLIPLSVLCQLLQCKPANTHQFTNRRAEERFGLRLRIARKGRRGGFFTARDTLHWLAHLKALYRAKADDSLTEAAKCAQAAQSCLATIENLARPIAGQR